MPPRLELGSCGYFWGHLQLRPSLEQALKPLSTDTVDPLLGTREFANQHRPRTPRYWCRRRAPAAFHGPVQSLAIRDVDRRAAAMEGWQRHELALALLGAKQSTQRRLNKLRHRAALTRRLELELCHDGIIDVERGLPMGTIS